MTHSSELDVDSKDHACAITILCLFPNCFDVVSMSVPCAYSHMYSVMRTARIWHLFSHLIFVHVYTIMHLPNLPPAPRHLCVVNQLAVDVKPGFEHVNQSMYLHVHQYFATSTSHAISIVRDIMKAACTSTVWVCLWQLARSRTV